MIRAKSSLLAALLLCGPIAMAGVSQQEANRLGNDLTPVGGEKAGNKDGTIPAWNGGITRPPSNYKLGDHHPDPTSNKAPGVHASEPWRC